MDPADFSFNQTLVATIVVLYRNIGLFSRFCWWVHLGRPQACHDDVGWRTLVWCGPPIVIPIYTTHSLFICHCYSESNWMLCDDLNCGAYFAWKFHRWINPLPHRWQLPVHHTHHCSTQWWMDTDNE